MINSGEYIPGEEIDVLKGEHLKEDFNRIEPFVVTGDQVSDEEGLRLLESLEPLTEVKKI
jgi:hypothetical protein